MPLFRVTFRERRLGYRYRLATQASARRVRQAAVRAVGDARNIILRLGRANIASAGRFGTRWTQGLKGRVVEGPDAIELQMSHDVPYFTVFQFGKVIRGRPLLWIPLSHATDAQGVYARDFPQPLFRVDRAGKAPLLLAAPSGEPKYFGKEQVRIPKKFQVFEIIRDVSRRIKDFFRVRMSER